MSRTTQKQLNVLFGELGKASGFNSGFIKQGKEIYGELSGFFNQHGITFSPYRAGIWTLSTIPNSRTYNAENTPHWYSESVSIADIVEDRNSVLNKFIKSLDKFKA